MKVQTTKLAEITAAQNFDYIGKDKPRVALKIISILEKQLNLLPETYKAHQSLGFDLYSLLFYKRNTFRILYEVDEINQRIIIHAVLHCRQDVTPYIDRILAIKFGL